MTTTILALAASLSICLCLGLLGSLILVADAYRKLSRLITDASALQRMVTIHGDRQLTTDGRLSEIDQKLAKLQQRNLKLQSIVAGFSSIDVAHNLVTETGVTDAQRLALESGLTEREANLMIQLKNSYSTDTTSPPSGAK